MQYFGRHGNSNHKRDDTVDMINQKKPNNIALLAATCVFLFGALETVQIGSRAEESERTPVRESCPPEGSIIALFSRQAFDEGREAEFREHGKYFEELARISMSSFVEDDVVEKSLIASVNFEKKMRAQGHDIRLGDLIIDGETSLNSVLSRSKSLKPIMKAQLELRLAVVREMKRVICR